MSYMKFIIIIACFLFVSCIWHIFCHKKFLTNLHAGLPTYICFLGRRLLNTQHTTIRAWNCLIPGAVVGSMLSYLSGAAWRKPTWYRTKMLRARKGENFQKPMTPLCKGRMKSPTCSSLKFLEPTPPHLLPYTPVGQVSVEVSLWAPCHNGYSQNATQSCPPCVELLRTPGAVYWGGREEEENTSAVGISEKLTLHPFCPLAESLRPSSAES